MNHVLRRARLLSLLLPLLAITSAIEVACSSTGTGTGTSSDSAISGGSHVSGDDDGTNSHAGYTGYGDDGYGND